MLRFTSCLCFFFFNDTATTEIYTLSLHDALPIWVTSPPASTSRTSGIGCCSPAVPTGDSSTRSEEHTSELQSQSNLVCRLLLEKKKHTEMRFALYLYLSEISFCTACCP